MGECRTLRAVRAAVFYSKPNLQSGIGAFIGLISLSLVWMSRVDTRVFSIPPDGIRHPFYPPFTLFDLMEHNWHGEALFGGLFIVGAIVALASPIGGVFQASGLLGIAFGVESVLPYGEGLSLGPGYLLAIVSTFIVLTSVSAIRSANGGKPARILSRFAALSPGSMSVFR